MNKFLYVAFFILSFEANCFSQNVYQYDSKGRIVILKFSNCKTVQYTYDGDGNRTITQKSEIILSPTVTNISCFGSGNGAINLTKKEARILEQKFINQYGLGKNGGYLLNKINSIARKRWWKNGIN